MPLSSYVRDLRAQIGHSLLLLPGVTVVITDCERVLLVRQRDTGLWSLLGGGVEPGEDPGAAVEREVLEELGIRPSVGSIIGAYGGPDLTTTLPNGDQVSYVTIAYRCSLPSTLFTLDQEELIETRWFDHDSIAGIRRHTWIDRVITDLGRT